jgi:flagellin
MPQFINTNAYSLNAQRNLNASQNDLSTSLQRLSSGLRINSARDDAAGLAISDRLTSQIRGLNQAVRNANDGISLAQVAEGALQESTNILQRMRELSIQSANGSNSDSDRQALQAEVAQLQAELTRIADTTAFGGRKLFDGTFGQAQFQVGAEANQTIAFALRDTDATQIGVYRADLDGANTNVGLGHAVAAAADLTGATNNVAAGSLVITGEDTATVTVNAGDSAREIATAVNAESSSTGVAADARTVARISSLSAAGAISFTLGSDSGTSTNTVTISATITATGDLTALANAINAESGATGIQAVLAEGGASVDLISESGDDITIENFTHSVTGGTVGVVGRDFANAADNDTTVATLTDGGTDSTRIIGEVQLSSTKAFSVEADTDTVNDVTTPETGTLASAADVDISTVAGSQSAIGIIDGALNQIDSLRADLGAVQNRLASTISNLQNVAENVSVARSQIRDADFAKETAELTRNQILQQAGIAMLSQANAQPQNVLSLLQ